MKSKWQPIETAPKGEQVLVLWLDGRAISSSTLCRYPHGWDWEHSVESPTHWMPLPEPPEPVDVAK